MCKNKIIALLCGFAIVAGVKAGDYSAIKKITPPQVKTSVAVRADKTMAVTVPAASSVAGKVYCLAVSHDLVHWELADMTEAGLTPVEFIVPITTSNSFFKVFAL